VNFARVATAVVLAPAFVLAVWYGSVLFFTCLIEIIAAAAFVEYSAMAEKKGIKVLRLQGLLAVLIIPLAFSGSSELVYLVTAVTVLSVMIGSLGDPEKGAPRFAYTLAGIFYICVCFTSALLLRNLPEGQKLFLLICFATWGADIGAYYVGRFAGKHKLAPNISPGKTVEGFAGGILGSFVFGLLFAYFLYRPSFGLEAVAAGAIGGIVGPLGDLCESMLKRHFGVKDSGTILPGHGGILDRTDAVMVTIPVFYIFMALTEGLL